MNRKNVQYIISAFSVLVLLTGLLMTLQTFRRINSSSDKMAVRIKQIETVRRLNEEIAGCNAAFKMYESMPDCSLRPVSVTVKERFPDFRADTIKDFKRETMPGWSYYEKEISFVDVKIGSVLGILHKLELQRPPWRLMKCLIKASSRQAGTGRVIVTIEGLERAKN